MQLRTVAFAALLAGCALPAGQAWAQIFPPLFQQRSAPQVQRSVPPTVDPDDDDLFMDQPLPGPYARPPRPDRYGRYAPPPPDGDPQGTLRPPAGIYPEETARAYPPRYGRPEYPVYPPGPQPYPGTPAPYPGAQQGYATPPQPGYGAPPQPGYGPPPGPSYQQGYGQQPGYGAQPGY